MLFAAALPALLVGTGVAVDVANYTMKQSALQAAADAGALAGAKELAVAGSTDAAIKTSAVSYAKQALAENASQIEAEVDLDRKGGKVKLELDETWHPFISHFFSDSVTPIKTHATARIQGASSICVLSLSPADGNSVDLNNSAKVTANNCGIYANSTSPNGIVADSTIKVKASLVCAAGGVKSTPGTINPNPTTDCVPIDDPLSQRAPPVVQSPCIATNLKIVGVAVLSPGTYCGGLEIAIAAAVTFNPGVYTIKDGPFKVSGLSFIKGKDVGFYLLGDKSVIDFTGGSTVDFSGSEKGAMAGLLFFEDRNAPIDRVHRINTMLTIRLTGTIYLPRGKLKVDPKAKVGEQSDYTAIIANKLEVSTGPELILNSNYDISPVPVPTGIRGTRSAVLEE